MENQREVVVVDIKMPFWSMVMFMVKWAVASVPALVVLAILLSFAMALMTGLFGGLGHIFDGVGRM